MNRSRRAVLLALTGVSAASALAVERPPLAPDGRRWRIGWLLVVSDRAASQRYVDVFIAAMRERGWAHGEHYDIDTRYSGGDSRRFSALAAELVAAKPDVLMAIETTARAYRQYTTTIPIVLFASVDPVAAGLVQSLVRPGTNVTGISNVSDALTTKNVEALFEIVPRARRIVLLTDPLWSGTARISGLVRTAARERGAELDVLPITTDPASVRAALDQMQHQRPDGALLYNTASIAAQAAQLHAGIVALRLPASGSIEAGSVVRHGWNVNENLRESTEFVDRILRGASPAELPVRQLMRVEVTLDLRTAREIGIEVPASLRARADRVIE